MVWVHRLILTLVLTLFAMSEGVGNAAPTENSELPSSKDDKSTNSSPTAAPDSAGGPQRGSEDLEDNNLLTTPQPERPSERASRTYYYPYRKALSPMVGFALTTDRDTPFSYSAGINYLWPKFTSPQAEIGADIMGEFGGHIHFSVRKIWFERSYYRPYVLGGITHEVDARDGFATILDWENYYLHAALGFEDVVLLPKSARLEIRGMAGLERQMLILLIGGAWAW